ncbi:ATP-dependent RecD-like DNA helicase [Sporotomaculum syntrophicum]|uniref:ATP-dependent RecD-like DNA helicase n=1 Tax=Sporotomaculum syntrophicum TaxID=182264 RepID=A0A9D2WQJ8_9FIRM|nr:AAA family ATPase [Sporotomaculum syntrophicum]KAF1085263.1 ATP-dependent RecD-like DNA helicase [Sporotomaculum syntrophicum]
MCTSQICYNDFASQLSLTKDQQEAAACLSQFLLSDSSCFLLKGYAGTGKTFLIRSIADYLHSIQSEYVLMAPTGRAAKVIVEKTGHLASTIHRVIYSEVSILETRSDDDVEKLGYRVHFKIKNNEDGLSVVYIIDESSLISNIKIDNQFLEFGTDYLLDDIFSYADIPDLSRKIIFVGDNAQLSPVGMDFSPALDVKYLSERYGVKVMEYVLMEVVRQKKESGILANATAIRDTIKSGIYNKIDISATTDDVCEIAAADIIPLFCGQVSDDNKPEKIIIAYSNRLVNEYNWSIREKIFPGIEGITAGDQVMVVKNNYSHNVALYNGDMGRVVSVSPNVERRPVYLKKGRERNLVVLCFRNARLRFLSIQGAVYDINCKFIENLLESTERELSPEEMRALYVDFRFRYPKLKPGTQEFSLVIKDDPYFNAIHLKYAYSVTCHKAQGGEWNQVFVDFQSGQGCFNRAYLRWAYTALTRSRQKLFAIHAPHYGIMSKAVVVQKKAIVSSTKEIKIPDGVELPAFLAGIPESLVNIYLAVLRLLEDNDEVIVKNIVHHQYCERYLISAHSEFFWINLYYNKEGVVTRVLPQTGQPQEVAQRLVGKLQLLANRKLSVGEKIEGQSKDEPDFPADKPFLRELYLMLKERCNKENIRISHLNHHQYNEKYEFAQDNHSAIVSFFYNKIGNITTISPESNHSNSTGLLNRILEIAGEMKNGTGV